MQGWRMGHEDAHAMRCDATNGSFWVLDGHGGEGVANYGAGELLNEVAKTMQPECLPDNETLVAAFLAVDARARAYCAKNPEKDSGSTVIGAVASRASDTGLFTVKLLNCGDSRGLVVRGTTEEESSCQEYGVDVPAHIREVDAPEYSWPVVTESVDHKPSHPTERARIEAANGKVSDTNPPRLDSNLAVSRGLGDFEYKSNSDLAPADQKVSCVPDIYEVAGLPAGSIIILACDGVWDVMTSEEVADMVRERMKCPKSDLGDLCADVIRECLAKESRDNVTMMIIHLADGTTFEDSADEMKNHEKLSELTQAEDQTRKQYQNFCERAKFPLEPKACMVCNRWTSNMNQCACKTEYYCGRACQKKGWKTHKGTCVAMNASGSK